MSDIDNANPSAQWSEADGSNTAPAPDGFPQASGQDLWVDVPANGRAIMGAIKRFWDRINGTVTSGGSAGAYTYTPAYPGTPPFPFPSAYVQGETYTFKAFFTSVGGDTLNVNSLGAKPLYRPSAAGPIPIAAGDLQNGQIMQAIYDSALSAGAGGFQVVSGSTSNAVSVVGSARNLIGSAPGGVKTASWTADELVVETALGGVPYKGSSLSLNFNGASPGAGGMDTGSTPTSADLYVYAIYSPGTGTWSTLGTTAGSGATIYGGTHMPSGYTASCLLWAGKTDGSGNVVAFNQIGREVFIGAANAVTGGSASSITAVSITSIVPVVTTKISGYIAVNTGNTTTAVYATSTAIGAKVVAGSTGAVEAPYSGLAIITAQTLYYVVSGTGTATIGVTSYEF